MSFRSDSKRASEIVGKEKLDIDLPAGKVKAALASECVSFPFFSRVEPQNKQARGRCSHENFFLPPHPLVLLQML